MIWTAEDEEIVDHVDLLGKLPPEWWQKWDARTKYFNEEAVIHDDYKIGSLAERFEESVQQARRTKGIEEVGEEEKAAFLDMIKAMMAFKPEERMTIRQVKKSKWMKKWALPEIHKLARAQTPN